MKRRIVLTSLAIFAPSGVASATGFVTSRFGGEMGHPTTDSPTAIYYNPAALTQGKGMRLYLDGTFAWIKASHDRPEEAIYPVLAENQAGEGTPASAVDRNSGKAELFNVAAAPFIGFTSSLPIDGLTVALALYAPFGGASKWDRNDTFKNDEAYPGAYDGPQRWWSIEGSLRSVYITGAAAYRLESLGLSFGLGLNLVKSEIKTLRARNANGGDALVTQDDSGGTVLQEGRSLIDVAGTDLSAGLGVLWEPNDAWAVGLSYQSQPGFGEMELEGKLKFVLGGRGAAQTETVKVHQELPDIIRLGGRHRPSKSLELRLFGELDRWSVFDRQCLVVQGKDRSDCPLDGDGNPNLESDGMGGTAPASTAHIIQNVQRNWQDAVAVRAGASYWLHNGVELVGGLGYDGNAVPDEQLDPAIPDFHDVSLALGGKVKLLDDALAVAGTYTQIIYFSREIAPLERDAAGVPITTYAAGSPSLQPDAAGKYERAIGVFNLNVEYTF